MMQALHSQPIAPVSVVIPTFNTGHLIAQALDSVLSQVRPPDEIIVVDDGSTDNTRDRVASHRERVRYLHQSNQGVSAARNHGVAAATQEFVAFLDADDVWHPRKLELQMEALTRRPELGLLGTLEFSWPAATFPELDAAARPLTVIAWEQLVVRNYLHTSSIVVRRDVLNRAGSFDRDIQGPEDRDLWLRVAEIAPVANLALPLTGYRDVPGSVSKQARKCREGMLRILQKLDRRGVWNGRWLLRRMAYSYVDHSSAYLYGAAGSYGKALGCSLRSLLWCPFPYRGNVVGSPGERLKRLGVNLLRMLRLKSADSTRLAASEPEEPGALDQLLHTRADLGGCHE